MQLVLEYLQWHDDERAHPMRIVPAPTFLTLEEALDAWDVAFLERQSMATLMQVLLVREQMG